MWLSRSTWASLVTQNARLTAEATMWEAWRDEFRAERERLRAETERIRADAARERDRADRATDELLALRGIGPVTPPPTPPREDFEMFAEDPDEVGALRKRLESEGVVAVMREQDGDGRG